MQQPHHHLSPVATMQTNREGVWLNGNMAKAHLTDISLH